MDNQRGLTIVLWVIVLFGIFFLARGLTGKAVLDVTVSNQCVYDKDCASGMVCCNSMCYSPEVCSQITNSTTLENPQTQGNYFFDIGLGFFILIAVLIAFYAVERKGKVKTGKVRKVRISKVSKRKIKKKRR